MAMRLDFRTKRGVFFSLIAILTISLFVLAYKSTTYQTAANEVPVIEDRVRTANQFINNLHDVYVTEIMEVSLKNAFYGYHDYLLDGEDFDSDQEAMKVNVKSLMQTGGISDTEYNPNNLDSLIRNITTQADSHMRLTLEMEYDGIEIFQDDYTGPWFVGVKGEFDIFLDASVANWTSSREYTTYVHIDDLYDPYHTLNTLESDDSFAERRIRPAEHDDWNAIKFVDFVKKGQYNYHNESPSFFNRLVNDSTPSLCCGIETFITEHENYEFGADLGGYHNVSFLDICYFDQDSSDECQYMHKVKDLSTDYAESDDYGYPFRASGNQIGRYNITEDDHEIAYD